MVERRSPKPKVTGSIPVWPAILILGVFFMSKFNLGKAYKNLINEYKKIFCKSEVFHVTVIVLLISIFVASYLLLFDTAFNFILTRLTAVLKSILGGA